MTKRIALADAGWPFMHLRDAIVTAATLGQMELEWGRPGSHGDGGIRAEHPLLKQMLECCLGDPCNYIDCLDL